MRPRISIARLLAFIGLVGVALAALRSPSNLWANAIVTATVACLVVAVINAVYGRGRSRAYWAGFLIAGGAHFLLGWVPILGDRLVTLPALDLLYPHLVAGEPVPVGPMARATAWPQRVRLVSRGAFGAPIPDVDRWTAWTEADRASGQGAMVGTVTLAAPETFRLIGHSLVTLLVAMMGGLYARRRFDRCHAGRSSADVPASFSFSTHGPT